ncbi:trichohyalin-like isoform X12 [Brienomyrus brachyistius]|uniref:trichohyalin-like isoform X12 n=1 Tax=Brienomyrus brachyistius TaxID=42636 RepID=UPI0020B3B950|nr:trichohyalin-like isoform X12 [Brienomyrus brachyistius]
MAAQVEVKSVQGETAGVSSGHLRRTAEPPSGTQGHIFLSPQAGKPALLTPKPFSLEKTLSIRPILPPKPQVPSAPPGASQTSDLKSSELSLADSPGVLGGDQTRSMKSNTPTAPKPALHRNPEINPPTVVIHDLSSTLQSSLLWNSKSNLLSKPKLDLTESSISVPLNAPKANLSTTPKPDDPSTPKPTPPHTPKPDLSSVPKPVPLSTPNLNLSKSEVFASPEPLANQATSIDSPEKPRKLSVLERIKMLSQFRTSQESSASECSGMTQTERQPRMRMGAPISRAKSMGSLDYARWEALKDMTEEEQSREEKSSVSPLLQRNIVVVQPATPQSAGSPHKVAAPRKTGATGQLSELTSRFESLNTPDKCQPDKENILERKGKEVRCTEEVTESQPSENADNSLRQMMPEWRKQDTDQEETASSIKKRISLLFDPSSAQGGGVSTPLEVEPHSSAQPIQEVDISVGVKQRIKQLIAESPSQSLIQRKVKPRPLSQDLTKCFSPGMSMDTSPSTVGLERVQMRGVDKKEREAHEKVEDPMADSSIKGQDQSGGSFTTLDQSGNGGTELELQELQSNKEKAPVETPENVVSIIPSLQLGHLDRSAVSEGILSAQLEEKTSKLEEERQKQMELERKCEEERQKQLEQERKLEEERQKQLELERKREEERQKQLELERKREEERQKQLEQERKLEEERQKQLELERKREEERQKQLEQERKREEERQKQLERKREEERQKQLELERKREEERQKQLEQERKLEEERQKQLERKREEERQKQLELERKREEERQKQLEQERKLEEERQRQLEQERKLEEERQRQLEQERKLEEERQRQLEQERKLEEERQKQLELERKRKEERQKQLEQERKLEEEKQKQLEQERKREEERQKQLELERKRKEERQKQLELERKQEEERQKQLEQERKQEEERQKQLEKKREEERQKQLEQERKLEEQKQLELERKREEERQKQLELDRKNQEREVEESPQQISTAGEILPTSQASSSTLTEQSVREGDENATTEEVIFDDFSVRPMRWRYMRKSSLLYGDTFQTSQPPADAYDEGGKNENYVENLNDQEQQGEISEDDEKLQKKVKIGIDRGHDGQGGVKQEDTKSQGGTEIEILDPIKQPSNRSSHLCPGEKLEAEEDRCSAPRQAATQPLPKPATCIARTLAGTGPREEDGTQDRLISHEDDQYGSLDAAQHPGEGSLTPNTSTPTDALPEPSTPGGLPSPSTLSSVSCEATDPLPFPETPTSLLDSSALRSRVLLGKRRSQRALPSRAARQKAVQDAKDPKFQDSAGTGSEMTAQEDVEDEEEEEEEEEVKAEPCLTPSQPQRVPLFPGMDTSALKAQLKKRVGDSENQAEQPPPQRSAKSPFLPQATRVLPPIADKENRDHSSPQWLQELKSKKRFSQHESDT